MASRTLLSSTRLATRLSKLSVSSRPACQVRFFGSDDDDKEDPFGLKFEDGPDKLGKNLPPTYVRDSTTGKFTGEVMSELSPDDEALLNMNDVEKDRLLVERLTEKWNADEKGEEIFRVANQIAEEETALNTLGRNPRVQGMHDQTEDGDEAHDDETSFSKPLSPDEFKSFARYMKKEHDYHLSADDIPVMNTKEQADGYEDNPDLDFRWMSTAAQREMEGHDIADPLADLMPHDMNPTRLVNRKKAKPIPRELLHHNNLGLLRRYVTPNGQIMNRQQSRLGAKDQRKISKLIKRARNLGLIPHMGQWKYENHGNMYAKDIDEDREWEKELERRGLVVKHD